MLKRITATLFFSLTMLSVFAGRYDLLLRTGTVETTANAQDFVRDFTPAPADLYLGNYYLVVQFEDIPSLNVLNEIGGMGVQLMDYLPNNAYVAAIPQAFDLQRLVDRGARMFMRLDHTVKLSPALFNMEVPEWAKSGNEIDVVIRLHDNVNKQQVIDWIASRYMIVNEYEHPTLTTVRAHPMRLMALYAAPFVQYLEPIAKPSTPDDKAGRSLHRSNVINSDYGAGRHYSGDGVTVGLADDGLIGPHVDYTGRLTQFATSNNGTHGDMTAGIMFGAGNRDPIIRGHATGAYMYYWSISGYVHIVNAMSHYANYNMTLTSTSYSQGQGGQYTTDAQFIDQQIHDNPQMIHVFSAGNAGSANHGYGAGPGWGNITGGYKAAKHVITCANLRNNDQLENSSSRGPAADGRIKPDIAANGYNQLSTNAPNTNQVGGGTSAAAPSVAGTTTQLFHAYKSLNNGQEPESYLIKACILNTAEDLGNAGPDYRFGWGRINAMRAVRLLETNQYVKDSVLMNQTKTHTITVPANAAELRVMCYWLDPQGSPSAAKALVNDLTLTVTAPNMTTYNCWKLDPTPTVAALNSPAVRGIDDLNTMEQVTLDNPVAGTYTVNVTGTTVPSGDQAYYVVYEYRQKGVEVTYPLGGEGFDPGDTEFIRWEAAGVTSNYTVEYSTNSGASWTAIANNVNSNLRQYTWNVPNIVTGQARVRVTSGIYNDMSDADFTIVNVPSGLAVTYVCPDSIGLTWNPVAGATGYEVSMLGTKYMDALGTSMTTTYTVLGQNPNLTQWFSVKALTPNNGFGERAIAIEKPPGTSNCVIPVDAALQTLVSPGSGSLPSCQASASSPIIIDVRNSGTTSISNLPVRYSVNGAPSVNEMVSGPIAPGATVQYTFTQNANLSAVGAYTVDTWTALSGDGNIYNDSAQSVFTIISSPTVTLPLADNMETYSNCNTSADCEATNCNLGTGWRNATNLDEDDIDWRIDNGGTPSSNTGPSVDHNPGSAAGKYAYLEASSGCESKEAHLVSPCIDLTGVTLPELSFWYHMNGTDMGQLHVDVISEGIWTLDVVSVISGNQQNIWRERLVSLNAYIGKVINIRIRGVTGNGFTSDIAIDDINVRSSSSAPAPAFTGSPLQTCQNSTVFLTDQSTGNPTAWAWAISPATFNYVGGTSASSQNPEVQFTAPGFYTVSLTATNSFGSNTTTNTAYININAGASAPLVEGFSGVFLPTGWSLIDPGGSNTWEQATGITGITGGATDAAYINNFNYNNVGAEDELVTMPIDLTSAASAMVTFDVAYVRYSTTLFDSMRVDISTDCGQTFTATSYNTGGTALATGADNTADWSPAAGSDWRTESLNLSAYAGNSVVLKFVAINGYGNNLYLDNVNISTVVDVVDGLDNLAIDLYPNPGEGRFQLRVNELAAGPATIAVHDLAGRQVYNRTVQGQGNRFETVLSLNDLPKGVYYLRLNTTDRQVVRKLVIQ